MEMISEAARRNETSLRVAIDLNAAPPVGIGGVAPQDKAREHDGQICYGALGVGGLKMKLHKAAIKKLFESNDAVLNAVNIYSLAKQMAQQPN